MTIWLVEEWRCTSCDLPGSEVPCFRIFPDGEPERWIARTNPDLPPEIQEEAAALIADALSRILGV
jgi:hypothetical protein